MHAGGDPMRKLWFLATLMSVLVIMLPVCFSADYIKITKLSGKDGIWDDVNRKGYTGKTDFYAVEVEAEREDTQQISADTIKLFIESYDIVFNENCNLKEGSSSKYICSYKSEQNTLYGGKVNVKTVLYQDNTYSTILKESPTAALIIDDLGPTVTITDDPKQEGLNITLKYSATDSACADCFATECTGIDKVEFYDENSLVYTDYVNVSLPDCSIGTQQDHKVTFFMGGDGNKTLTLKAYDKVGNIGAAADSKKFPLDHSEPSVVPNTFKLLYQGAPIDKIPSEGLTIEAVVWISEEQGDLDTGSVNADFRSLNTQSPGEYSNVKASCSPKTQTTWECRWGNIVVDKAGDASSVQILAKDNFGNEMKGRPSSYPINTESTPPAIYKAAAFKVMKDNRDLKAVPSQGAYADIYVNLTDEFPGINTQQLFADFTDLNGDPNYAKTPVSSCQRHIVCTEIGPGNVCLGEKLEDYWACVWRNVFVNVPESKTTRTTLTVSDQFGNMAKINQNWKIELDDKDPAIKHLGIGDKYIRDGKSWLKPSIHTTFIAIVEETGSGVESENVNFKYAGSDVTERVNCTESSGEWLCFVNHSTIGATGTPQLEVMILDNVGNAISGTETLTVDGDNPVVNSVIILSQNPAYFAAGDTSLTITANLTDASGFKNDNGEITAVADLSEVYTDAYSRTKATDCTVNGTDWICTWVMDAEITSGARNAVIRFNLTDVAGNTLEPLHTKTITIRDVEDSEPDFFKLEIKKEYIMPIEKFTLENIAGYYYQVVPFDLKNNGRCADAEVYNWQMRGTCDDSYVTLGRSGNNYVGFVQLAIDPGYVDTELNGSTGSLLMKNCRLEFTSRCTTKIYAKNEKENLTLAIPIVDEFIGPEDNLIDEIEKIKKETKTISTITKGLKTTLRLVNTFCGLKNVISVVLGVFNIIKLAISPFRDNPATQIASFGGVEASYQSADLAMESTSKVSNKLEKVFNIVCGISTCKDPKATGWQAGGGVAQFDPAGGWCDDLKLFLLGNKKIPIDVQKGAFAVSSFAGADPLELSKKSWFFSIACMCLPGVIYNLDKYQQNKCWKAVCYRDYVAAGFPKKECETQYAYLDCVYMKGQWTAFIDLIDPSKFIASVVQNWPAHVWMLAKWGAGKICEKSVPPGWSTAKEVTCGVYAGMQIVETIALAAQQIISWKDILWKRDFEVDYCDLLRNPPEPAEAPADTGGT